MDLYIGATWNIKGSKMNLGLDVCAKYLCIEFSGGTRRDD